MKEWARYSTTLAAVIGATIVAATGHDAWGWLIVVAIFTA